MSQADNENGRTGIKRRGVLETGASMVALGLAGCAGNSENGENGDEGQEKDDDGNDQNRTEAPEIIATEIEFQDSNGEELNNLAQVKVQTDKEIDPANLSGKLHVEELEDEISLNFSENAEGDYTSQEALVQAEGTINAEMNPGNQIQGRQQNLQDSKEYQLTGGINAQQRQDTPGIIETRLEPDNSTAGSLENLAAETLEAEANINGETQQITLEKQENGGYTAHVNAYRNGEITENIEIEIEEIEELEGFKLEDGKLTLTTQQALQAIDPEKFISAEEAYKQTYSEGAPISKDDLDNYQNGEITDFGQLIKEINDKAPTVGTPHEGDKAVEVYKQIGHNLLDLDRDQYRVIKRSDTAGVDFFTVFYRQNTNQEWNKALGTGRNYEDAEDTIVLPTETQEDLKNSAAFNLYGMHTPEDPTNQAALDFQQITDAHERQSSKEEVSDERWRERTTDLNDYNDLLIPGGGEIGYTADVRGHMQNLIDPRTGEVGSELELVDAASEYFHNAVPEDKYMQIDIDSTGKGDGEKLMEIEDGEAFYATTVDQETHEENFMALYDPDISS